MSAEPLQNTEKLAYSETDAAKILGISSRTLFTLRAAGRVGFVKLSDSGKSRVLYPLEALKEFLAANTTKAVQP